MLGAEFRFWTHQLHFGLAVDDDPRFAGSRGLERVTLLSEGAALVAVVAALFEGAALWVGMSICDGDLSPCKVSLRHLLRARSRVWHAHFATSNYVHQLLMLWNTRSGPLLGHLSLNLVI